MDIRVLTDVYAVSPQITPADVPAIAAAGFRLIICNRFDDEVVPGMRSAEIERAAQAAGIAFARVPLPQGEILDRQIQLQKEAIAQAAGPVLAYCASGTRSLVVWMFGAAGTVPVDDLLQTAIAAGYPLTALRPQLERTAQRVVPDICAISRGISSGPYIPTARAG